MRLIRPSNTFLPALIPVLLLPSPLVRADGVENTPTPTTPAAFQSALAERRQANGPPLVGTIRLAGGIGEGEEAGETVLSFRWTPGRTPRFDPAQPDLLPQALRGIHLPLLDPQAIAIRGLRRSAASRLRAPAPRPEPRRRPAFPALPGLVVGPQAAPVPSRPPLPDEYALAEDSLLLEFDLPGGAAEAVVDPRTLHVRRLHWRGAGARGFLFVEDVWEAAEDAPPAARSLAAPAAAPPRASSPPSLPRGALRVSEGASDDPQRAVVVIDGAAALSDGAVVEVRLDARGEDLERGPWTRELGRQQCAVEGGRFQARIGAPWTQLATGGLEASAAREGDPAPFAAAAFRAPAEAWRRALAAETRVASRVLDQLDAGTGRPVDARTLAAAARERAWDLLPATRRAVEHRLRALAAGEAPPRGGLDALRRLLAREARWAALVRLESSGPAAPTADREAVRRAWADALPLPPDLDRRLRPLAEVLDPDPDRSDADPLEGWPPLLAAAKRVLRGGD
jgi:hypothetical protein